MAGENSVLASQNFQAAFWGMFSNQQLGSLKVENYFSGCL